MSTSAAAWRKNNGLGAKTVELDLPSGNKATLKRISLEEFIALDIIPDSLMGIIESQMNKKPDKPVKKGASAADAVKDPRKMADMFTTMNRIAELVFVEPPVRCHEVVDGDAKTVIPDEDRDENFVYTDEIDINDKSFAFNFAVGGSKDLDRFRKGTK